MYKSNFPLVHKENLHLPLTAFWFNEIESGRKDIDYRLCSDHWESRLEGKTFDYVIFSYGYTKRVIKRRWIKTVILLSGINTDLKVDKPVYAIYFEKKHGKEF